MSKICTVTTINAPLHEIVSFVNYHLNYGIDRLFLYFDAPDDPALSLLRNHDQISCIRCDDAYWYSTGTGSTGLSIHKKQNINANHALKRARKMGFDWIIHIDGDELLFSRENIKKILQQTEADVLRFEIHEAVPDNDYYPSIFKEKTLFRKCKSSQREKLAQKLGCNKCFFANRYFRGHIASKTAVRVNSDIISLNIHLPVMASGPFVPENTRRIKLLHFDCCGFDAWKRKWTLRLDDKPDSWQMRTPERNMQFQAFQNAFSGKNKKDDLLAVYRLLHFIPPYERLILRCLDMLTSIRLDKRFFRGPIALGSAE